MSDPALLAPVVCALLLSLGVLIAVPPRTPTRTLPWAQLRDLGRTPAGGHPGAELSGVRRARAVLSRRRLEPAQSPDAATLLDLTAAVLRAGVGIEGALRRLAVDVPGAESLDRVHRALALGQEWEDAWRGVAHAPELKRFGEHLAFAYSTGAPTAELLELTAVQERARRRQRIDEQAARLGVQMVLPLGLCFLPAFILLGVIPVVLGLMQELA